MSPWRCLEKAAALRQKQYQRGSKYRIDTCRCDFEAVGGMYRPHRLQDGISRMEESGTKLLFTCAIKDNSDVPRSLCT